MANTRSRKYQLTFNNPVEHGINHEAIKEIMKQFSCQYYCMADEIGEQEQTPHTHLFFYCKNAVSFNTVKKRFPTAHIEAAKGTSQDNRDYIRKEGRHIDKSITSIPDTFEEFGELADDTQSKNESVCADVLDMIKNGYSNSDIINAHPSYISKIHDLDNTRNTIEKEKYKNEFREIEAIYIFGKSKVGKTRFVLETYGYDNVYRVTDYKNPFDNYNYEDVLFLDDFQGEIPINDLLHYLEGYPCTLPARYNNKQARFTKVYIASNLNLDKQYQNIKNKNFEKIKALLMRISKIYEFSIENNEQVIFEYNPFDYIAEG